MKLLIIIITSILTIASIPYAASLMLYTAWTSTHRVLPFLVVFLIILLYIYVWSNVLEYTKRKQLLHKKKQVIYLLIILMLGGTIGGFYAYDGYQNQFAIVQDEIDLTQYQPFESDQLATLREPSSLKLIEQLPSLDGATALYPVYSAITQAVYPKGEYSPYGSNVMCSTTPEAYNNLLNEVTDLIFVAAPSRQQKDAFTNASKEMVMTPIGKEAFVFFVHADNPVDSLTMEQIRDIYSGKIVNWKQVGGDDESIKAFQRPEGSGSQSALLRVMGNQVPMKPLMEDVVEGMGGIISQTTMYQNRENAIGFSFRFFSDQMVANKAIKLLSIDGIAPSKENIQNETYPIVSPFYAIHLKSNNNLNIEVLLDWITSPQGKELIDKTGYVAY